jgi:hypothetical protein
MSVRTTTTSVDGVPRRRPNLRRSMSPSTQIWTRWRASRQPKVEPELELPVLDREPDRIFQLPAGIK